MNVLFSRRDFLQAGGALVVGLSLAADGAPSACRAAPFRRGTLDPTEVDGFLAIDADGSVTIFCGKVDLGQGLRIAIPQMAAEELGVGLARIDDDRGRHRAVARSGRDRGSTRNHARWRADPAGGGHRAGRADRSRGGRAGTAGGRLRSRTTARCGRRAAARRSATASSSATGSSRSRSIRRRRSRTRRPTRSSASRCRGPTFRARSPDGTSSCTTSRSTACCTAACCDRPRSARRSSRSTRRSIKQHSRRARGARQQFPRRRRADEWAAISAAKRLKTTGRTQRRSSATTACARGCARGRSNPTRSLVQKGDAGQALATAAKRFTAEYYWPLQTHASMGPSCAIADVTRRQGDDLERVAGHASVPRNDRARVSACPKPPCASSTSTARAATA